MIAVESEKGSLKELDKERRKREYLGKRMANEACEMFLKGIIN